jgi:hypothetical protein
MGQIVNAEPETGLIIGATPSIPGGATELGQSAGPQATDLESVLQPTSQFASAGGPQTFFRRASDSMGLSNERSATNRFNRLFSSSSCRRRRSSLTAQMGGLFLPRIEGGVTHPELPVSACRIAESIWSSENFDRFMGPLLSHGTAEAVILR